MSRADPVLIFDLDGTILAVNSFPRWVMEMIACRVGGLPWRRRIRLSLAAQALLLGRKVGRTNHDALLAGFQGAWRAACGDQAEAAADRFAARLLRHVRPALGPALERVAKGEADAVLATAAAEDYVRALGRILGFRHILAAPVQGGGNRGARKRESVLRLIRDQGWEHRSLLFFTDHLDDLPLIQASHAVFWFGSPREIPVIRAAAPCVTVRSCHGPDLADLMGRAVADP
jgi:phosphoserine phosphatase